MDTIVLLLSQAHAQSLIAITNALVQSGWQPPKFSSPDDQQATGVGLKALDSSALTILQEDLTALHVSHATPNEVSAIDSPDHSAALRDGLVRFRRGLIVRDFQHGAANILHSVDICSPPGRAASHIDEGPAHWSPIQDTETYSQCCSDEIYSPNAPFDQAYVTTEKTEEPRAPWGAQMLAQVIPRDPWSLGRKPKNSSSTDSSATLVEYQLDPSLACTGPLSNTKVARSPTRRVRKPVAADFFTPESSVERGEVGKDPSDFTMVDIEDLIKEERVAAVCKQKHTERSNPWSIPDFHLNPEWGVSIKGTAGEFGAPDRGFRDSGGRVVKKVRPNMESPANTQLQQKFGNESDSMRTHGGFPGFPFEQDSLGQPVCTIKAKNRCRQLTDLQVWSPNWYRDEQDRGYRGEFGGKGKKFQDNGQRGSFNPRWTRNKCAG